MLKKTLICLGLAMLVWSGCARRQTVRPPERPAAPPPQADGQEGRERGEPSIRFSDWQAVPEIDVVYFDYDSSELRASDRRVLQKNADYLKTNPELMVLVEGHCDERGTTEYNLALGQRRASAVRDYYGQLGIPLDRVGTISYGEENPVDPRSVEEAWLRNRRAETKVRTRRVSSIETP